MYHIFYDLLIVLMFQFHKFLSVFLSWASDFLISIIGSIVKPLLRVLLVIFNLKIMEHSLTEFLLLRGLISCLHIIHFFVKVHEYFVWIILTFKLILKLSDFIFFLKFSIWFGKILLQCLILLLVIFDILFWLKSVFLLLWWILKRIFYSVIQIII